MSEISTSASSVRRRKRKLPDNEYVVDTKSESRQCLSVIYRDRKIKISDDKLTANGTSTSGYSTVLSSSSASQGKWYYELHIEELPEGSHIRAGWSTRRTRFDCPIGSDCFSYAVREIDCAKIALGRRWSYGNRSLHAGDVIGCYVTLSENPVSPKGGDLLTSFPNLLCDPENVETPDVDESATIEFSVNGEMLGPAFISVVIGEYYPAVSIYGKGKVRFDFSAKANGFTSCEEMFIPKDLVKPRRRPAYFIPKGASQQKN